MEVKKVADRIIAQFGLEDAKKYVVLWQDEYIGEKDRVFRQQVKKEVHNR